MPNLKLYEIANEIEACFLDDVLDTEKLDALQVVFEKKVQACAIKIQEMRAVSDTVAAEIARLQALKRSIDGNQTRLTDYLLGQMQRLDIEKVEEGVHRIRRQKSPLKIEVVDKDAVPQSFKTEVREVKVNLKAIADFVKETGEIPPGVEAGHGEHLRFG